MFERSFSPWRSSSEKSAGIATTESAAPDLALDLPPLGGIAARVAQLTSKSNSVEWWLGQTT